MRVATMSEAEAQRVAAPKDDAGLGALRTERGNLPLDRVDVHAAITGLVAADRADPGVRNPHDVAARGDLRLPAARPGRGDRDDDDRRRPGRRGGAEGARRRPGQTYDRRSPPVSGPRSPRRSGPTSSPCGSATSCPASG